MPPDPLIGTLIDEVDHAIATLQAARKLLVGMQRAGLTVGAVLAQMRDEPQDHSLRHSGMTVAEAADVLQISEEHVRRLLRRGELVGVPFSGHIGWRMARAYIEEVAAQWQATRDARKAIRAKSAARRGAVSRRP